MNWKAHVDEEMLTLPDDLPGWIPNTQANHHFPSHKHVTKPTVDSGGKSFVLRVITSLLPEVSEAE